MKVEAKTLGEFEELVLLIVALKNGDAYGLDICNEIQEQTDRVATIGAVHATVARLEKKGLVVTHMGEPTNERGGRRKRLIRATKSGMSFLVKSRDEKVKLWGQIPELTLSKI